MIDETTLQEALNAIIKLPDDGKLHHKCTTEGVMVLIWDFEDFTPCSSVLKQNFKLVKTRDRFFEFKNVCSRATISLPYFILEDVETDVFRDKENQILKEEYVYPEVSEKVRQSALLKSLQVHHYNVDIFDSSKTAQHFCRFSGDGDLYITGDNVWTLVFVSPGDEDSPAADKNSLAADVDSPAADEGESRLLFLLHRGKKTPFWYWDP